jgi:hypothetical protein
VEQALDPKYATFSLLVVLALYALSLARFREKRPGARIVLAVTLLAILGSIPYAYKDALRKGRKTRDRRLDLVPILLDYRNQSDEALSRIHLRTDKVRDGAAILERLGYNAFAYRDSDRVMDGPGGSGARVRPRAGSPPSISSERE